MFRKVRDALNTKEFQLCRDEINSENRMAIRLLALSGIPLSLANIAVQWAVVDRHAAQARSFFLLGYFIVMLLTERFLIPKDNRHTTAVFYVLEAPVMLISILLGTVWDPNYQATTFFLFLLAMPVFILDQPWRSIIVHSCWTVLFVALCVRVKDSAIVPIDLVHALEFFLSAAVVTNVVMRVRMRSLRLLQDTHHSLTHDRMTGCLNRYALAESTQRYLGKPLFVVSADLDRLSFYNDFYGRETGDAMAMFFVSTLSECFGAQDSYRYAGDEVLCVLGGTDEEACTAKIALCREKLGGFTLDGRRIPLNCAFGYVSGTPRTAEEFRQMTQLSDIYAHRVKMTGEGQTLGGAFDQEALRAGIVESNILTHAHAYETNRLTGLPGMSYFTARADDILSSVADPGRQSVIGYFKLVHLRDFNDRFGYAQGDELIAETARLLRELFAKRLVCYITAGQYGILCYRDDVEPALDKIRETLKNFRPGFAVRFKAGFSPYTGSESSISLLDEAKIAQKSIRRDSRRDLCFYDDKLDEEIRFRQYVINHLDEAIENGWLKVYYQSIIRSRSGEICNEEALSRWDDPQYGFLMPFRFIPTLEENGLMYKVNLNVVRQVLRDFAYKEEKGIPIVPVSVNLSRRDFDQCDMVSEIMKLIDASGFSQDLIKIEITESAFTSNQELIRSEVARFRENGFEVWLDDFGSEYSTLNLLQEIDFDLIKLDMRFMQNFTESGKNYIIVSDILDMAKRMGITTLTEGVETAEQVKMLQELGCEKLQGYLFSRPSNLDCIESLIASNGRMRFEEYRLKEAGADTDREETRNAEDSVRPSDAWTEGNTEAEQGTEPGGQP